MKIKVYPSGRRYVVATHLVNPCDPECSPERTTMTRIADAPKKPKKPKGTK